MRGSHLKLKMQSQSTEMETQHATTYHFCKTSHVAQQKQFSTDFHVLRKPKQQNILCNSKNIHLLLKIILSNQVELNPGSINSSNNDTKYPCYVCNESVLWTEKGVACDRCDQWFHTKCINMSTQTYIGLDNSANWFCNKCESPDSLNSIYQSVHIDSISSKNSLLNSTNFSENGNSVSQQPRKPNCFIVTQKRW